MFGFCILYNPVYLKPGMFTKKYYSSVREVTQQFDQKTCPDSNTTIFYLVLILIPKLNIYSVNLLNYWLCDTDTTTHKHKQPSLLR